VQDGRVREVRAGDIASIRELVSVLPRRARTLLIGIDGRGGSGKSTLAHALAASLPGASIVQFDDFYRRTAERRGRPSAGEEEVGFDFDWRRVCAQVLEPLANDESARYQRYDWDRDRLADWHEIQPGEVLIVEGNYAIRPELRAYYDFTIWVEAPHDVRLRRGLERDGDDARATWLESWMPEEERYVARFDPRAHADVVADGTV
jgi:uridine kinase